LIHAPSNCDVMLPVKCAGAPILLDPEARVSKGEPSEDKCNCGALPALG
jgi:hypothetical protein